jgi:hypothetical protein
MELRESPPPQARRGGLERIACERLSPAEYLLLYRAVGEPLRWNQRSKMSETELAALLDGDSLNIYVLRDGEGRALFMQRNGV